MVQFKLESKKQTNASLLLQKSQFHYGSIQIFFLLYFPTRPSCPSQFHYGSIQIKYIKMRLNMLLKSLNSTMVQFKCSYDVFRLKPLLGSQFHYGSIQIYFCVRLSNGRHIRLNSTMVQFK